MCVMLRPKGLPKKVAYSILGVPDAIRYKPTKRQRKITADANKFTAQNFYR